MLRNNYAFSHFAVYDATLKMLKDRKEIVALYDLVGSYEDAVWQLANFLNGHLKYVATLQEELPELLVLAWYYANMEFGMPLKESAYEEFVEALRPDVYKLLMSWVNRDVGMKELCRLRKKKELQNNKH
jgi:hypothetical protein